MTSRAMRRAQEKRDTKQARRAAAVGLLAIGTGAPLGAAVILAPPAEAATITVTNNNDSGAGSLRAAVAAANASTGVADTIDLSGRTGVITLTSGELEITDDVTITGPGSDQLTIEAGGLSRVFDIHPADGNGTDATVITGLTVDGGTAPSYYNSYYQTTVQEDGGAVLATSSYYGDGGSLSLDDVTVSGSDAASGGGLLVSGLTVSIDNSSVTGNSATSSGGGIRNFGGSVAITDSDLSNNTSANRGGAAMLSGSEASIRRSTVNGNDATSGTGGGLVLSSGNAAVEDTVISGNTSGVAGGGLMLYGLYNGGATVRNSLISDNSAYYGGLYGGADGGGAVLVSFAQQAQIENVTVSGNSANGDGGGLRIVGNIEVNSSTITGNTAGVAGGGAYASGTDASLLNSIVANNSAATTADDDVAARTGLYTDPIDVDYTLIKAPPAATATSTLTAGSMITGQDPQLGALGDNGGLTQTMKPAAASPVVDKGKSFGLHDDERGRNRPVDIATIANRAGGDGADMGAVELSSVTDVPPALNVANTAAPTVPTTAPVLNVPVTVSEGTWTPTGVTFSYQWYRGVSKIPGATARSYVPVQADEGHALSVRVTGQKTGYNSLTVESNATDPVAFEDGEIHNSASPSIGGTAAVGSAITVTSNGTWDTNPPTVEPLDFSRQWMRNGAPIAGATGTSYVLGAADLGKRISVRVTASLPGWVPDFADSAQTAIVAKGTLKLTGTPAIKGKLKVGRRVTAVPPACTPTATITYQWLRNGHVIANATHRKYKLRKKDKGKHISVRVTFTKTAYNTTAIRIKRSGTVKG